MAEPQRLIVKLSSASGEIFEVEEAIALQSQFVRNVMEDVGVDSPIPLPNVSTEVLRQVLQHCKHYRSEKLVQGGMKNLYDLIMAANYMHIETLLHRIYYTVAMMIAKRTFGEIRQIFNFTNGSARGECSIGNESRILASFIGSLPTELQLEIKIQVAQRFHYGEWSPWHYDVDAQVLVVELANLYDVHNVHQQIAIILLHVDIGLVNTLVLQTSCVISLSPLPSGRARMEWVDQTEMEQLQGLLDSIDMLKIEELIFDEEGIY